MMLHSPETEGAVHAYGSVGGPVASVISSGLGPKLIAPKIVEELTSLKRRSIDRAVKSGRFPKPVRLSDGRIAFVELEILRWNADRIAERDSDTKAAPAPEETDSNKQPASPAEPQHAHAARAVRRTSNRTTRRAQPKAKTAHRATP
jgi:predicted DNA-binding transcriptional regulator AlpA